ALWQFYIDKGLDIDEFRQRYPRLNSWPFDSERKLMSTIQKLADGRFLVTTKGAPDELLKRCLKIDKAGQVIEMTEAERAAILATNHSLAKQ
ncbi:ATPase, partial [[Eubacterium] rectale]|nr:ATPase [Agathobacter rectalis]